MLSYTNEIMNVCLNITRKHTYITKAILALVKNADYQIGNFFSYNLIIIPVLFVVYFIFLDRK